MYKPGDIILLYDTHSKFSYRDLVVTSEEYYASINRRGGDNHIEEDDKLYTKGLASSKDGKSFESVEEDANYWRLNTKDKSLIIEYDIEYLKATKLSKEVKDWLK